MGGRREIQTCKNSFAPRCTRTTNPYFQVPIYPKTLEEFNNRTYHMDEIINMNNLGPSEEENGLSVKEVATFWSGKCFLINTPQNWTYSKWLGLELRAGHDLRMHFLESGQVICLVYGYCTEQLRAVVLGEDLNEAFIEAKKIIRPPG